MTIFRSWAIACFAVLLLCVSSASAKQSSTSPKPWLVTWQPKKLVNGSPVLFRASPSARLEALSGAWLGHSIQFRFDPVSKTWYGFAGVSLATSAGSHTLELEGTTATGKAISYQRGVQVYPAKYPKVAVNVPKQFTEPSAEQLRTIAQDKSLKDSAFEKVTPVPEWAGDFDPPVEARVSDVFGTARVFNGKAQSVHQGLDYAVPSGTPVRALNQGTVLLARPLYFEGNCVVLDHGQGLLTLYLHFSEFAVKEGDVVQRGQVLGLSGGTGRATGPHLHIAVRWQGVYLDPATLLRLQTPKEFAAPPVRSESGRVPRKD